MNSIIFMSFIYKFHGLKYRKSNEVIFVTEIWINYEHTFYSSKYAGTI